MEKYDELQQYLRIGEPDAKTRAELWQTAIGLQKVDGLEVSDFLVDTAKRHIEGDIDIDAARKLITNYYQNSDNRASSEATEEADTASSNIVKLLAEQSFTFSVETLISIHRRIFQNVFKHAGKLRDYDISKKEWVLDGASVLYGPAVDLLRTLQYDFGLEKGFRYANKAPDEAIKHFAAFISGIWQIHPFREGNTRTTAVFAIKYLRSLGFKAENDLFKEHSWYFRNALVRANYQNVAKGIQPTDEFLVGFFRNLLLDERNDLKNRYLHVRWPQTQPAKVSEIVPNKVPNKVPSKVPNKSELIILKLLAQTPSLTRKELMEQSGLSDGGVKKILSGMKENGWIERMGSKKTGHWLVKFSIK